MVNYKVLVLVLGSCCCPCLNIVQCWSGKHWRGYRGAAPTSNARCGGWRPLLMHWCHVRFLFYYYYFFFGFLICTNSSRFTPNSADSSRFALIRVELNHISRSKLIDTDWYQLIQADTSRFRPISTLNQADSDGLSALCLPSLTVSLPKNPWSQSHSLTP